jgi:hypothetical protein
MTLMDLTKRWSEPLTGEKPVEMLSRLAVEMKTCALVSGRSACSR